MKNSFRKILSLFLAFVIIFSSAFAGLFEVGSGNALSIQAKASDTDDVDENILTLPSDLPLGKYTLKYENSGVVLPGYADICTLEITEEDSAPFYDSFIKENSAPKEATAIGVYFKSDKVGEIDLNGLASSDSRVKQYSFAAISDTHIGAKTSETDLQRALTYFENVPDVDFTTICGDLTLGGTETNFNLYKSIVETYTTKPVYAISGNHEANAPFAPLAMDSLKPYTGQDLYYSFNVGDDVFIMMGMHDVFAGKEFAEGQLQWLYETLEENRNKRCFLFMHLFPRDGSGDAVDLDLEGDMLNNTQGKVFYSLLSHYSNVIYFHGHSHQSLKIQETNKMNNYDNVFGCHSVHVPSLTYPKSVSEGALVTEFDASEGYIIDVYENEIMLKGRDFSTGEFLPVATYSLDTTIKDIPVDSYCDPTGTIINSNTNVLKTGGSWYCSDTPKDTITEISFVKEYSGVPDEEWDASLNGSGKVTVYREGQEIFIRGSDDGIAANSNSAEMFADFVSLTSINGFENIDKTNITSIEGMFKNCAELQSLDLSDFTDVKPLNISNAFSGCSSLEEIDLSAFDLSEVRQYLKLFNNCSSLKNVTFGNVTKGNVYMSGSFKGCRSIENVDLSGFKSGIYLGETFSGCSSLKNVSFSDSFNVLGLNNCFNGCLSLRELDISSFNISSLTEMKFVFKDCVSLESLTLPEVWDTSNVKTMESMFYNCPLLELDCSDWDTKSLTNSTSFNYGSPGVIFSPAHTMTKTKVEPTCTEQGYTIHTCSVCGYSFNSSYIEPKGHCFSEWECSKNPDCITEGFKSRVCADCGVVESENLPPLGHDYGDEWIIDSQPTCTENGSKSRHCSRCDCKVDVTVIEASGHTVSTWIIDKAATCTEKGTKHKECTACGLITKTATIKKLPHAYSDWVVEKEPTCTDSGSKYKECTLCGATEKIIIESVGHISTEWLIDKEANCTEKGLMHKECTVCGVIFETVVIDENSHSTGDWIIDKTATCTEDGIKSHYCTTCNSVVDVTVIEALGHKYENRVITIEPTCTEDGSCYVECSICDETITEVMLAEGHNYSTEFILDIQPTCVTYGCESRHCLKCDSRVDITVIEPIGHSAGAWVIDKKATSNQSGIKHKDCVACGIELKTAVIPQLKCKKPELKSVTNVATGVRFTWNKVTGADNYEIYRKKGSSSWEKIATVKGSVTSYTDKTAKSGTTYKYTVKANNEAGVSKYNTTGLTIKCIADPVLKTPTSSKSGITLKWNKIKGADGYVVYRKKGSGKFVKLATVKGATKLSYVDKSANKGMVYTYKLKAYCGKTYSPYSNAKTIKDKY